MSWFSSRNKGRQIFSQREDLSSLLGHYGLAVAAVVFATLIESAFFDIFEKYPLYLYWPVVLLVGWIGGVGPGLVAAVLSIGFINYFLLPPRFTLSVNVTDALLLVTFAAISVFISWVRQRGVQSKVIIYQRQQEMETTLASIGDGVIVTNAQGQVTYINPVAAELTGWSQSEAVGHDIISVFNVVNEETRQPTETPVLKAIEQGIIVGLANHTVLLSRTGKEWPISDSGAPIRNMNGEIVGAVLVFRDIEEQRERERALEASEARYRHLVDNASDVIYTLDLDGRITSINPAAEKLTGYESDELLAMSLVDLVPPEDKARVQQMNERQLSGEGNAVYELEIFNKHGDRCTLEVNSQLTYRDGNPFEFAGIARDITARKKSEWRSTTLHNIGAALAKAITVQEVASVIIDQVLDALGAHHGAVGLVSDDEQCLDLLRLANSSQVDFEQYRTTPLEVSGPMTDTVRNSEPVWIVSQEEYIERYPHYKDIVEGITKTQAAAALPLHIRSQVIGSLMISFPESRKLEDDEKDFLETIADYCAQSIERAQLYEAEQHAREALQVRVRQQSIIAEIGQEGLTGNDLSTLMDTAAMLTAQTLEVEFVKILELHPDEGHLLLKAGVGWRDGYVGKATEGMDIHSPAGYTLKSSGPIIVEDLRTETRFSDPPLLHEHGVISGMSVIIQGHDRPYGVLGVYTTHRRIFSRDDIYFIQSMANVVGAAIENTRLSEQTKAAATMEERQRLARELHDSVTQSMFAATSRAEIIPRLWERDPNMGMEHLQQVIALNRGAMAEMRSLLLELRPEAILNNSLKDLCQQLIAAAPVRADIQAELIVDGDDPPALPPDVHLGFYRIVQESVNNVLKHSQANKFQVVLSCTAEEISATITDDGRGFDEENSHAGLGMGSMRERAEAINASLKIDSIPGEGTTVRVRWVSPSVD